MSREKGGIPFSGMFETQAAGALDARTVVDTKADLMLPETWLANDGEQYTYVGLTVTVTTDTANSSSEPPNNGIYILQAMDYTDEANWLFITNAASQTKFAKTVTYEAGTTNYIELGPDTVTNINLNMIVQSSNYFKECVINIINMLELEFNEELQQQPDETIQDVEFDILLEGNKIKLKIVNKTGEQIVLQYKQ